MRAVIVATIATLGTRIPIIWDTHYILPRHPITVLIRLLAQSSRRIQVVACSEGAALSMRLKLNLSRRVPVGVIHIGIDTESSAPVPLRGSKAGGVRMAPSVLAIAIVGQVTRRKGSSVFPRVRRSAWLRARTQSCWWWARRCLIRLQLPP